MIRISGSVYPDNKPLFLQIKEKIEDQIVNDQLLEGEKVPSTTQLSSFYKIEEVIIIHRGRSILQDDYESLTSRGVSITGPAQKVDELQSDD